MKSEESLKQWKSSTWDPATFPGTFSIKRLIWRLNFRPMVNFACCRSSHSSSTNVNILSLVYTSSPLIHISAKAIETLIGKDFNIPNALLVEIYKNKIES